MTLVRADELERDRARSWVALMAPAAELSKAIASTDFVPRAMRGNAAAIAAAILYGDEVGLGPMQSLAKIAVIDGRPFVAAEAQRALVYAAGHELWLDEATNARVTWAGRRSGSEQVVRITWTMDDARRARLDRKPNWINYPRQMLSARASAELVRALFADVVGGLAALEEVDDLEADTSSSSSAAPTKNRRSRKPLEAVADPTPAPPISTPDEWRRSSTVSSENATGPGPDPGSSSGGSSPPRRAPLRPPGSPTPAEPLEAESARLRDELGAEPLEPAPITRGQRNRMHGLFRRRGIDDRRERLRLSSEWVGRTLSSSSDLTSAEADRVLDVLEAMGEPDDGAEPPAGEEPGGIVDVELPLEGPPT